LICEFVGLSCDCVVYNNDFIEYINMFLYKKKEEKVYKLRCINRKLMQSILLVLLQIITIIIIIIITDNIIVYGYIDGYFDIVLCNLLQQFSIL